jgi:hypothetical protein
MNIECRSNEFCLFYKKKTERSEPTLRHSTFDIRYSAVRFYCSFIRGFRVQRLTQMDSAYHIES